MLKTNIRISFFLFYILNTHIIFTQNFITVETSVRSYIRLEKLLLSVFLFVCVWLDSFRRNYPIRLKFGTNVSVLCEISCIVLSIHCRNSSCTGVHKSISIYTTACGGKFFKISFDMVIVP